MKKCLNVFFSLSIQIVVEIIKLEQFLTGSTNPSTDTGHQHAHTLRHPMKETSFDKQSLHYLTRTLMKTEVLFILCKPQKKIMH